MVAEQLNRKEIEMTPSTLNNKEACEAVMSLFGTDTIPAAIVETSILFTPYVIEVYGKHAEEVFDSVCKGYPNCTVQIET